ncbi:collagen-binding protein [Polaribacter pacificus]|uniref:Collagen-binding protein n=1 Tax=Polaribacter pacificus TaxID=1775173 RepID=A0A917HY81_9FLAO|nr:outer membrane beta-barrel protein [Polaribacter pacificus]GGG95182.1 collagen-binding protein [Polaribacter pacificus]
MTKKITLQIVLFFALAAPMVGWAQTITGKVIDSDKTPLEFVSVAVINAADSTLVSYTTTDKNGAFKLTQVTDGKRIFQINLVGFATYQKVLDVKGAPIEIGTVTLLEKSNTLDEIQITAVIPITIKKDTTAFNTKAFKVRVDDTVEDLLKKLPGVEVDADGKVKAQGEDVSKVYVDGKEFFSGDPTIALKNLSADAIKSIELIDEKSDKARVTGVNDSSRSKVINLKLKDDRKVNDFGKFQGGYGTDDRFLTSINYNRFSPTVQASVIARYNNINSSGSDISQIMSFGGGGGGGSYRISRGGGGGTSSGFVTTGVGGLNLGYELKPKQNLNADYFYNYSNSESGKVSTKKTEFVGNQTLYSETESNSVSTTNNHKANFSFIDRSSALRTINMRGRVNTSETEGSSVNSFVGFDGNKVKDLENNGVSTSNNNSTNGSLSVDYITRFSEKSTRNIEVELDMSFSKSNSTSANRNDKDYTDATRVDELVVSTQKQEETNNDFGLEVKYTEPIINDRNFIEVGVGADFKNNNEYTDQNQTLNGSNNLSSTFMADLFENRKTVSGNLDYKYNNDKLNLTFSARFQDVNQNFGLEGAPEFNKNYSSLNPSINLRYRPKQGSWFVARLNKSMNVPSLNQVSPVVNNYNPLFISTGNQNLTAEDSYSAFLMYGMYDFVSGFNIFSNFNYSYTNNAIVNTQNTDVSTRVRTSSYVNLGTRDNVSASLNMGKRMKSVGMRYNVSLGGSVSNYQSVINSVNNKTNTKNINFGLTLENNDKDNVDLSTGATFSKSFTTFSGTTSDRDYLQQTYFVKSDWNITKTFNFSTQFKYDIYTDSSFGTEQAVPIWNASLSYAFLKSKNLSLMLTALDMLNKNVGFDRSSSDNYFQETTKEVLGTYYMVSLTYTLNGNKGKSNQRGGRQIRSVRMH